MPDTPAQSAHPPRYCLTCRYNLAGLAARECPECARPFDPADPRTTAPNEEWDSRRGLALATQSLTVCLAIVTGCATFLSAGGVDLFVRWFAGILLAPFLLMLLVGVLSLSEPLSRRWRIAGLACAAALISIILLDWPFRITFELHRPALNRIVHQIESGQLPAAAAPTSIGIFNFRQVQVAQGNVGFQLTGGAGGGIYLVHAPPGSRWIWRNTNWEQNLLGGWFRVYED